MARFFCIFHALSFALNLFFDRRFPLISSLRVSSSVKMTKTFVPLVCLRVFFSCLLVYFKGVFFRKNRSWTHFKVRSIFGLGVSRSPAIGIF